MYQQFSQADQGFLSGHENCGILGDSIYWTQKYRFCYDGTLSGTYHNKVLPARHSVIRTRPSEPGSVRSSFGPSPVGVNAAPVDGWPSGPPVPLVSALPGRTSHAHNGRQVRGTINSTESIQLPFSLAQEHHFITRDLCGGAVVLCLFHY